MSSLIGNQPKLLKYVVYCILDRQFLATFTWSGKSVGGKTKKSLSKSTHIIDLFYSIVSKIDSSYNHPAFIDNLKNKIMKYAYEHGEKNENAKKKTSNEENVTMSAENQNSQISPDPAEMDSRSNSNAIPNSPDRRELSSADFAVGSHGVSAERHVTPTSNSNESLTAEELISCLRSLPALNALNSNLINSMAQIASR